MPPQSWDDRRELEKYSSAFTMSDMEVYIFPELLYALVLGNIMSPRLWQWRDDPWFAEVRTLTLPRQAQRLKQYIMEHYTFNLDLETWGLTTKTREMERFAGLIEPDFLARSNALFGYEGDRYYFDLDIRRHFGLDQYHGDVIPYWKTETVEAMDAFRYKPGHQLGAGECVSLSALYAAALYVVLGIPLEDIFLLATPLHSQNFVARGEGFITNNRRLVTKKMWFNGSEISQKARRALEHERVTIVSHITGYAHVDYPRASIHPEQYQRLQHSLKAFLSTPMYFEIFANFLRAYPEYRRYFQFEHTLEGRPYYIPAETLYRYEHNSKNRVGDRSRAKLLSEVEMEEFTLQADPDRYVLNGLEKTLDGQPFSCREPDACHRLQQILVKIPDRERFCQQLIQFTCVVPQLPSAEKTWTPEAELSLPPSLAREEIIARLQALRTQHPTADLAFYVHRRLDERSWHPFFKSALERNPVIRERFRSQDDDGVYQALQALPSQSIYDDIGMAQPDEVVNFGRGDGLEKAIALAAVLCSRHPQSSLRVAADPEGARVEMPGRMYCFPTQKGMTLDYNLPMGG